LFFLEMRPGVNAPPRTRNLNQESEPELWNRNRNLFLVRNVDSSSPFRDFPAPPRPCVGS
jgi:hypothetical protein